MSEGWPKVIAEGMFWGCLPIATRVSCVPNMLNNGKRGIILELTLQEDVKKNNDQKINKFLTIGCTQLRYLISAISTK